MGSMRYGLILIGFVAVIVLGFWSALAMGYPAYREPSSTTANPVPSCYSCHSGFYNRGALHNSLHVGSTKMTNACTLCHTATGDIPKTNSSGMDASHACNGCHIGPGLRQHHAAAGAPADSSGLFCADCHDSDPTPPYAESTVPPYYMMGECNVKNPCLVTPASGGEDLSGDGKGLDNDGDLSYDQNDSDCGPVPVVTQTWGFIKSRFR
jgi:hypothetical protein